MEFLGILFLPSLQRRTGVIDADTTRLAFPWCLSPQTQVLSLARVVLYH